MSWAYVHMFWLTRPSCYAAGLVHICLSSLGLFPMSQHFCALVLAHWPAFYVTGLCTLVSAPCSCSLHRGTCVHLSWLCRPALYLAGLVCTCFVSPDPPSMLWGFFWLPRPTLCATRVLCTGEVCMMRLGKLGLSSLLWAFCRLLSVPQAYCVVEVMVHELFIG